MLLDLFHTLLHDILHLGLDDLRVQLGLNCVNCAAHLIARVRDIRLNRFRGFVAFAVFVAGAVLTHRTCSLMNC